ncbi:hypothetical protein ACH5RR_015967 [Cinchona calisaya]|uniref:VQ domain-containing protein n=1 Tax=Cinchona calisaya TaxID=153742 RepID=A0ABD2ZVV6_9GENT
MMSYTTHIETTEFRYKTILSPENSCTNYADSNAKDSRTKPTTRRRSRASKKTPMILLNANTKNFRALVQQFTGCQNASSTSFKGPINLNFGGGTEQNLDDHVNQDYRSIRTFNEYHDFYYKSHDDDGLEHQQLQLENLQELLYSESYDGDAPFGTSGNSATYATTKDNMAEDSCGILEDFLGDYSSIGLTDDDFIFREL